MSTEDRGECMSCGYRSSLRLFKYEPSQYCGMKAVCPDCGSEGISFTIHNIETDNTVILDGIVVIDYEDDTYYTSPEVVTNDPAEFYFPNMGIFY
jgi:hypothetical protein